MQSDESRPGSAPGPAHKKIDAATISTNIEDSRSAALPAQPTLSEATEKILDEMVHKMPEEQPWLPPCHAVVRVPPPNVRGVLLVTWTKFGWLGQPAPVGVRVRVEIDTDRYFTRWPNAGDSGELAALVSHAADVEVVGVDPDVVAGVVAGLRAELGREAR